MDDSDPRSFFGGASCPRCNVPLTLEELEQHLAARCDRCQGVLLFRRDMARVLGAMSSRIAGALSADFELPPRQDEGPLPHGCPRCRGETEHYGYLGAVDVRIDQCVSCDLVWLDSEELARMAYLLARTERRQGELVHALERARQDGQVISDLQQLVAALGRRAWL